MNDLISRQAAIDALDVLCQEHRYKIPGKRETYSQYNEAWQDALGRAENAIGNLPSAEPKPYGITDGLDVISRQKAIDVVVFECGEWMGLAREISKQLRQLPSAQPETPYCYYCNEDTEGYVAPIEKNGHAFVRFGMAGWELSLKANGWHGSAKIRYCPMCGRDLLVKRGAED